MCCRETLRLDNIVSGMSRRALQDVDLGGYRVPAGAMVQVGGGGGVTGSKGGSRGHVMCCGVCTMRSSLLPAPSTSRLILSQPARLIASPSDCYGHCPAPAPPPPQVPFTYFAQHDPRWAEATGELDPASFHPERLMTKEGAKPGWLMPFGHGPRFCIGGGLGVVWVSTAWAEEAEGHACECLPVFVLLNGTTPAVS